MPRTHRFAPSHIERMPRRASFVQYYPRSAVYGTRLRREAYRPRIRVLREPYAYPVRVARRYDMRERYEHRFAPISVGYVYRGYAPLYASPVYIREVPRYIPVRSYVQYAPFYGYGAPVAYRDDDDNQTYYNYPQQYAYAPQYSYPQQYAYPQQYSYPQYGFADQNTGNAGAYGNPFGNAELQGIVLSGSGSSIVVLTPNLTPVFVNLTPAEQLGYVSGTLQPGSIIQAYGYSSGNQFVATAVN
ncbi:MAG TPA: hypothetical protein VGN11_13075 [Candidatus Baltobacteraceae bacterium]|nr:hypothetical protein [Candidatus Baltobacteraceae bacterium]